LNRELGVKDDLTPATHGTAIGIGAAHCTKNGVGIVINLQISI